MSKFAKTRHKRVARAVGYVLTLGFTGRLADELTLIFMARLTEDEKAGIAFAALKSMTNEDHAYQVAGLVLFGVYRGEVTGASVQRERAA